MARTPTPDSHARRQLDIALAVAAQRAQDVHVRQALELVTHAHGRVGMARALEIYGRIHGLAAEVERVLTTRVFAALGQADLRPDGSAAAGGGLLALVRRRLGGRRDVELRRWVEFHKGRTDRELVDVHVDAVARVHAVLSARSVADAVDWYAEATRLSGAMRDNVYLAALARLDDTKRPGEDSSGVLRHPEARRRSAGGGATPDGPGDVGRRFRASGD